MFLGQYTHNVDSKGRLIVPARYRELLAEGAFLMQGFERNLMVFTVSDFERISNKVNATSITNPNARKLKRLIFATADLVEVDKTGRILIPQFLREMAGLDGGAVIVGSGDHFEIWSPEAWEEQLKQLQDPEANEERFAALDLTL